MIDEISAFLPSAMWGDVPVWDDNLYWSDLTAAAVLLPSSATPQESALEQATARSGFIPVQVRDVWRPETCPADILPWLAWGLSVDEWDPALTEGQRRQIIASSISLHRRKGTVAAVKQALLEAGLGDATLLERYGRRYHDGSYSYDGEIDHDDPDHWAEYRVVLSKPMSIAQAAQARRVIVAAAPARCHLKTLDFTDVPNLYDGALSYDGTYSHGEA